MTFLVGEQTFGVETRSLGTETRNLEIQDGEDVDVLRRPGCNTTSQCESLVQSLDSKPKQSYKLSLHYTSIIGIIILNFLIFSSYYPSSLPLTFVNSHQSSKVECSKNCWRLTKWLQSFPKDKYSSKSTFKTGNYMKTTKNVHSTQINEWTK